MPIPCLTRPFGAPLTVYFVLVRAQNLHTHQPSPQSSHDKYSNLNSYGNINPKPVNQRARDALGFPETSPFKRILQGAAKGAPIILLASRRRYRLLLLYPSSLLSPINLLHIAALKSNG